MVTATQRTQALSWLGRTHYRFPVAGTATGGLSTRQLNFMNRVLCRIETYSTNIVAMPHSQRQAAQGQLNELLAYCSSWVFERGYDNMDEALVGLSASGGVYSDSGTSDYDGGREKCFPHNVTASDPFVYFARALDERLVGARARLLDYHTAFEELAQRVAIQNPDDSTWTRVRTAFDNVSSARDQVERYHWLLAIPGEAIAGYSRSQAFVGQINSVIDNRYLRGGLRAYDLVSTLDAAARLSQQIQSAAGGGLPSSSQEAVDRLSHLLGFLRVVCHFLPILGSFYEAMFDGIPGLIANYRDAVNSKHQRIDEALQSARGPNVRGLMRPGQTWGPVTVPATRQTPCTFCGCNALNPCSSR